MGGAVEQILKEIFQTHVTLEGIKVAGSTWAHPVDVALYRCPSPHPIMHRP